jgi:hypothetical protein
MRKKDDVLLKSAFEESFEDLLRFFFHDADNVFDMERGFEFMDKELAELFPELHKKGGNRIADMLVKIHAKDGSEKWMLIHIEIQSQPDPSFSKRMFQYFYRIYDRYEMPISAVAVFTGGKKPPADLAFCYHCLGTSIHYEYNSHHILDYKEEQLLSMKNLFALIVLAAQKTLLLGKIPEQELGEQRLTIARTLIKSNRYDNERIKHFLFFLKRFIYIENNEINNNFDKQISLLTENQKAMGIMETIYMLTREEGVEEGMEKGEEKKSIQVVKNLLMDTNFDTAKIASLADVSEEFVIKVREGLPSIRP